MDWLAKKLSPVLLAMAVLLGMAGNASAQQIFGSIYGTVTDQTGGAVANAKVTISDINKGTKFEVTTNESGNYTRGQLIPGSYKVQVESAWLPERCFECHHGQRRPGRRALMHR